jgi:site-specific recombinase XerD
LTADRLKAFETELFDAGLSSGSVMGYHRVMKTFARFCLTEGYAKDEALLQVEGPKQEQYEPEVFTEEEEKRLIAAIGRMQASKGNIVKLPKLKTKSRAKEFERFVMAHPGLGI